MADKKIMSPDLKYWGRCVAYYEDGSEAGLFLISTHPATDGDGYVAFSERSGDCVSADLKANNDKAMAPYGREYVFSYADEDERTVYLEKIS